MRRTSSSTRSSMAFEVPLMPGLPSAGRTETAPILSDMPQRPTMERAMRVTSLQVALRAAGHHRENLLLCGHAAQRSDDASAQVFRIRPVAVLLRGRESHAQGASSRNDRHLAHRISPRLQHTQQSMARFVVGGAAPLLFRHDHVAGSAELDLLQRVGEIALADALLSSPRGQQRRLVDQVGELRARSCPAWTRQWRPDPRRRREGPCARGRQGWRRDPCGRASAP